MYKMVFTKQAQKDAQLVERAGLKSKTAELLSIMRKNPYQNPPPYEKLQGSGSISRRINIQHRLVYQVLPNDSNLKDENDMPFEGIVKIVRMWTHYE
jgi:Txe/YoeB family toxin of toxin-antitoxin system